MEAIIDYEFVKHVYYSEEEKFHRDAILPGFGIVTTRDTRDYYVERRVGCRLIREYLCPIDQSDPDEARELALSRLYNFATDDKPSYLVDDWG